MPSRAPVVLAADDLELRLVGLESDVWPGVAQPIGPSAKVLNQTLYARKLPCTTAPASPDLVSGSYTLRSADAGESAWNFPNTANSEGNLWRDVFSPAGRNMALEIWVGGRLEQVSFLDTVAVDDGRGFSSTVDATTFASSLQGNGAGVQDGSTGQLQGEAYDPPTLLASLYDVQAWQDFSDASFPQLLQALLDSQLALQLDPWQLLSADGSAGGSGQVAVHAQDPMFLLKGAYTRDWTVTQSPRDVIQRSTMLWTPVTVDNFPAGPLNGQWTALQVDGGTVAMGPSGGCLLDVPATGTTGGSSAKGAGTGADAGGGSVTWANASRITVQDGSNATATNASTNEATAYLQATTFGFSIPGTATITGVQAKIFNVASSGINDLSVTLLSGGSTIGSSQSTGGAWSGSSHTVGSSTNLWGASLTPPVINNSTFGVQWQANLGSGTTAEVDFIQIEVFYTTSGILNESSTNGPTSAGNDGGGLIAWSNPGFIFHQDGSDATANNTNSFSTAAEYLAATGFEFSVPSDATITGVQATIYTPTCLANDNSVKLVYGTSTIGTDQSGGAVWTSPSHSIGGSTNLWGTGGLTPAQVNSSTFGIIWRPLISSNSEALVDYITLTVYYTVPNTINSNSTKGAGSGATSGTGATWVNPGNITVQDSTYATATYTAPGPQVSDLLKATNFGFSVPGGSTVLGVQAQVWAGESGGTVTDTTVQLLVGGGAVGSNKATSAAWTETRSYGGSTDLWGTTLTVAQVNATNFGLEVAVTIAGGATADVDFVQLTVYYSGSGSGPSAAIQSQTITLGTATGVWTSTTALYSAAAGGLNGDDFAELAITESNGDVYTVSCFAADGKAALALNGTIMYEVAPAAATGYALMLESDGEWVFGFVNGQLIGAVRRGHPTTTSLQTLVELAAAASGEAAVVQVVSVYTKALQGFLLTGTDQGDYVLPGDAATYPNGGLQARYFNDLDLQSDGQRLSKIHAPPRTNAYQGSGASEYVDQQDAQILGQANPLPGAATSHWSATWFGSIWLELSQGDYTFQIVMPATANNCAVRVWVGKTQFGAQLVEHWAYTNTSGQAFSFTVSAASLAGTLSYDGGTVQRDGWYPIKIEYSVDGTAAAAPTLNLTSSPAAYTDPGGTNIAAGAQTTGMPATSLSPLGCIDQRYQGISHFDLCQQTLQTYGYQASVEPKQLESGLFPGVLAPRVREGQDYATIIKPDTGTAQDALMLMRAVQEKTWPLPGNVAVMRWRPGDGGRIQDRDINVWDTTPRQLLTFTRNIAPKGITSSTASFADRPVTEAKILKQILFGSTRPQRNYQRVLMPLIGSVVDSASIAAGGSGPFSLVALQAGDTLVSAELRIYANSAAVSMNVLINGTDETSPLNGPWTTVPVPLNVTAFAKPDSANNVRCQVKNNDATNSSTISYQLICIVKR